MNSMTVLPCIDGNACQCCVKEFCYTRDNNLYMDLLYRKGERKTKGNIEMNGERTVFSITDMEYCIQGNMESPY
uniref:Uncharacterized protein n=1 Tax=Arion vulgaris TaxID=1028688 RepID=A0A0B7BHR5_9EUPU